VSVIAVCAAGLLLRAVLAEQPPAPPRFDTELNQPPPVPPPAVQGGGYGYPVGGTQQPSPNAYAAPPSRVFAPPGLNVPSGPPPYAPLASSPLPRDGLQTAAVVNAPPPAAQPWTPAAGQAWETAAVQPWTPPPPAQEPPITIFKPGQIIAWVGDQPIQIGDLMPMVEQIMAAHLAQLDPKVVEQQKAAIEQQKDKLMRQALDSAIQTKLLYLDFLRTIPADKKDEILPKITSRAEEQFLEKQLPEAMEKAQVATQAELEAKLREFGSSIQRQKQSFVERALGQSVLSQKINYEPEITHQAMLDYYYAHSADYEIPARARWEKLTVRFDRFSGKQQAWAALGEMGNEVLRGAPLRAVAQRQSQGIDAGDGGYHDWTSRGSLASEVLDQAIFSLPVGRLSDRLEDAEGFHILRVIERTEAGRVPFEQAQVDIKETLRKEHVKEQVNAYVAQLKQEIPVWNTLDDAPQVGDAGGPARR
jgi:hypothetical protein